MQAVTQITFPNGLVFDVPTRIIAEDRTMHYTLIDTSLTKEQHAAETRELFKSNFAVVDWLKGNMDWKDVEPHAILSDFKAPDLTSAWDDAEVELRPERTPLDADAMAKANTLLPIEMLIQMTSAMRLRCTVISLKSNDGQARAAVFAVVGTPDVVEGYMAALQNFDEHMERSLMPPAAALN